MYGKTMTFDVNSLVKQGDFIKWAEGDCGAATLAWHPCK